MTDEQKNEEAHGLWELAVARLAAAAECGATGEVLARFVLAERDAFDNWEEVSERVTR